MRSTVYTLCQWWRTIGVLLACALCLQSSSCYGMVILSPDSLDALENDDATSELFSLQKRSHDPWDICPEDMETTDCFYTYLRIYIDLRSQLRPATASSTRNIGKRSTRRFRSRHHF